MNYRERMLKTIRFETVDELPFRLAYGLMPGVLEDWHAQGLPAAVQTAEQIYRHFGFPTRAIPLPVNSFLLPALETRLIEDTPEYRVEIDGMGRTVKVLKEYASIPLAMDFPIKEAKDWANYKARLHFVPERIGADLEKVVAQNIAGGHLNILGGMGFYWFPRDLMGDENLCIAYYEQPELVRDILETWCGLIEKLLVAVHARVKLDGVHFGEDMAYKNASMVGPAIFKEFIKPYYDRINALVMRHNLPIFSVDTDGNTNELIGWFADCGVNLIGPNEVNAGNDITAHRRNFGRRMAYDGGLDKRVLTQGRAAIDAMLERAIPFMKETGGGWCVCLDHRVLRGTPLADFEYFIARVRNLAKFG